MTIEDPTDLQGSGQIDNDKKSDSPVLTGADSVDDDRGSNVLQP